MTQENVKVEEVRIQLQNGETLIRSEEGIYFLKIGDTPPLLEEPSEAAGALLNELLLTQAERDVYKQFWQRQQDRTIELFQENAGLREAIEGSMTDWTQAEMEQTERLQEAQTRIKELEQKVEAQSKVIESYLRIEKDMETDHERLRSEMARLVARNLVAWDTSKDKCEGLLPEVYLSNRVWYERLTGEEYLQRKAIEKFNIE